MYHGLQSCARADATRLALRSFHTRRKFGQCSSPSRYPSTFSLCNLSIPPSSCKLSRSSNLPTVSNCPRFLLRRTAVRAISATPSKAFLATPRSISTFTPAFRTQQKWAVSAFQRRFASDDVVKKEEVAAEAPEDFAQTIAEPITEDGLTPVQKDAQAEPTNASETVDADALQQAGRRTDRPKRTTERREKSDAPPNNVVYVGNLYYEVTADQVKRVFSRFGEVENVKIVFDNRGLSRG